MKRRMNFINAIIIILTVFAVLVAVTLLYHRMALNSQLTWMRETLGFFGSIDEADVESEISTLKHLKNQYHGMRVTLIAKDGVVLYDSEVEKNKLENHADREEFIEALQGQVGESLRRSESLGHDSYYFASQLPSGNVVRLSKDMKNITGLLSNTLPPSLLIALGAILVSIILTSRTSRHILAPIDYYAENLDEIMFAEKADIPVYEELLPFVRELRQQKKTIAAHMDELKYQTETINCLIRDAKEGMILMDSELTIISYNQSAVRLLAGESQFDYRGKDFLYMCRLPEVYGKLQAASESDHESYSLELAGQLLRIYINRVLKQDGLHGVMMIIADDSAHLRLEKQRKEFTANVSHELRSPLTAINGYAELLKNGMVDARDLKRIGGTISVEGQRLSGMIDDIIKLSQFDEDVAHQDDSAINLAGFVEQILAVYKETIAQRGITLTVNIEGENEVVLPEAMLRDLLDNLLSNAVKYNRVNGTIDLHMENTPQALRLRVTDSGIGIPQEHQTRVFERFYRVDKARSREVAGSGLGLAIVKHIVEFLGGRIEMTSEVNKGTSIEVIIPKAQDTPVSA